MLLWEIAEYAGETLVFIGVVGEVFAEWTEPERKKISKISSIVLVIGLAISLAALIGTNEQFNGTISDLQTVVSDAKQQALDARGAANSAKDSSAKVVKTAEDLALESLELARVLDAESPRGLIISRNGDGFARALKPFRGQRFTIHICGADSINGNEERGTVESLRSVLGDESGWKEVSGNNNDWTCMEAREARVYVNSKAGVKAVAAARALSHQMSATLPPQRGAWFFVLSPTTLKSGPSPMYPSERELAWMVANDPNLIGILIGPRPDPMNKKDIKRTEKAKLPLK
jgi:hypothetical protein